MFFPLWFKKFKAPIPDFNDTAPRHPEITNIIRKMKSSGPPNPLGEIAITASKGQHIFRSYLTKLMEVIWRINAMPLQWRIAVTNVIYRKVTTDDSSNFRPITLKSIPLKVFASALRNKLFVFLMKNNYIETSIQKGFT